jgi:hypothetical protein
MRYLRLLLGFLVMTQFAIAAGPATERVTDKVVRLTDALEKDPLGDQAAESRRWLVEWLTDTPDYTVTVCDILGPVPSKKLRYGGELMSQLMFGNVAYQIRNPTQKDETLLQLAGVESVLKVYAAILVKDPDSHIKYFDELLEKQKQGLLKQQMAPTISKACTNQTET